LALRFPSAIWDFGLSGKSGGVFWADRPLGSLKVLGYIRYYMIYRRPFSRFFDFALAALARILTTLKSFRFEYFNIVFVDKM
jgi:hypothetical protein